MNYDRGGKREAGRRGGKFLVLGSLFLVFGAWFLVLCFWFLQGGGECFQGGGLDGGFVQVMEPGFIVNPPDRFRQTGRNTGGEIMKDDKRLAGLRRLRQLLKEAVNLPFPGGKPQNQ